MKKTPLNPANEQDPIASLMILISEGVRKAEKSKDSGALRNWVELGCSALMKFGGDAVMEDDEFRQILETTSLAAGAPKEEKQPPLSYEDNFTPEAAASILNSCILFCDVVIAGNNSAVALKYNEENMFSPIIVLIEKEVSAGALIWAADNLGVPVVKNDMLATKLASYGKTGEGIPEASSRDVSLVFARLGSLRPQWRSSRTRKSRQGIPGKIPQPLVLELGESLFALTGEDPGREKLLAEPLNAIRKKLDNLLGFTVPVFHVSCGSGLKDDEYRILFKGIEAGRGKLELGWYKLSRDFNEGSGQIMGLKNSVSPELQVNRRMAIPDMMINPGNIRNAAKAAASVVIRHVDKIIHKRAPELLGRDEVEAILNAAEEKYPVVTGEVKGLLSLGIIREILQSLVSEQVSIRHIEIILESLADWGSFGSAPCETIIEQIRQSLKRQICLEYTDDRMILRVLNLKPDIEMKFAEYSPVTKADDGKIDSTETEEADYLVDIISGAVEGIADKGFPPVILCSPKVRSIVKEATRWKLPDLAVLSYLEIPSDINVAPLGEIGLERNVRLPPVLGPSVPGSPVPGSPELGTEDGSAGNLFLSDPADKLG